MAPIFARFELAHGDPIPPLRVMYVCSSLMDAIAKNETCQKVFQEKKSHRLTQHPRRIALVYKTRLAWLAPLVGENDVVWHSSYALFFVAFLDHYHYQPTT